MIQMSIFYHQVRASSLYSCWKCPLWTIEHSCEIQQFSISCWTAVMRQVALLLMSSLIVTGIGYWLFFVFFSFFPVHRRSNGLRSFCASLNRYCSMKDRAWLVRSIYHRQFLNEKSRWRRGEQRSIGMGVVCFFWMTESQLIEGYWRLRAFSKSSFGTDHFQIKENMFISSSVSMHLNQSW